ncbi:MAG: glycerophosphodiester phosphodiesterase family protein, partial [Acidimicrobiales bacterium]
TTNSHGPIHSLELSDLRALDNAYWFVPGEDERHGLDAGEYPHRGRAPVDREFAVATLEEVLEIFDDHPGVALNLDIKSTAPAVEPYEDLLATALSKHAKTDQVIVASFLDAATEAFSELAPQIATSAGTIAVAGFWRAVHDGEEPPPMRHSALQVPAVRGDQVVVDASLVEAAHSAGMAVHVWTINDAQEMGQLCDLGVDAIISDLPTTLVGLLDERGLAYRA